MLERLKHLAQANKNNANPPSSRSGPGDPERTAPPSRKSRLSKWRIDPSSIEFPEDASEFRGGYATVSRAFLVSISNTKNGADNSGRTGNKNTTGGETPGQKSVAIKKLKIEDGKDIEQVLGLALREAGFLTELSHQNIIKLEGFVEDRSKNMVWLVFPWAANGNLKDFVASEEWEIPERISLINDVASGVEYLHNQTPPIYHGDLKSVNVVVNSEYRAVITDFGSARRLAQEDSAARPEQRKSEEQPTPLLETNLCEENNTITLTGNQYTLRWAAPELLRGDEPGLWGDIWALGWIFYEVMTNAIPFQNVQQSSVVIVHVIRGNLPSLFDHARIALIRALYSLMTPMILPDPQRASNVPVSGFRSPELLMKLGYMHAQQSDYIKASSLFNEALGICTDATDSARKADALFGLAEVRRARNEYRDAATLYSEVVQIRTETGNRQGRADALFGLAEVHRTRKEYSKAASFYSEIVQISTDIGDRQRMADALLGLAHIHRVQTEYSKAVPLYSEVAQIFTGISNRQGRADALCGLAHTHRLQKGYSKALSIYSEAVQICTDIGDRRGRANALSGLAHMHRQQKQYSQAAELFSEALQICIDIGNRKGIAWALLWLAEIHRCQGRHEDAICLYERAAGVFEEIGSTQDAATASTRACRVRQKLKPAEAE